MNNYRNQEAEAQREKHFFFRSHEFRWHLQLIRVADEAAVCGACGGKLGIFRSDWFNTLKELDGTGPSSRVACSRLVRFAYMRLDTVSICWPLG